MLDSSLFGILILDREPYAFVNLLGLLQAWLQDAGGFIFFGLIIYVGLALIAPANQSESNKERTAVPMPMLIATVIALLSYAAYFALIVMGKGSDAVADALRQKIANDPNAYFKVEAPKFGTHLQGLVLMLGGLFAMIGASYPVFQSIAKLSGRRIWALARLAFLEAVRNRVVWVLLIMLLPILFPMAWFLQTKSENELRLRVTSMSFPLQVVLLMVSCLLASFSIHNDVKNQNIYTIVTKPVQRFEIILGRFLGYGLLMTSALVGTMLVSLLFISTANINDKAREETYTARVPVRGQLKFESRQGRADFVGTDVGREFSYRKYIAGDPLSPQRAVWSFAQLPNSLKSMQNNEVPCEFTFDIFRLTKGEENRGVDVNIRVISWKNGQVPPPQGEGVWYWADPNEEQKYKAEAKELLRKIPTFSSQENLDVTSILGATPRNSPDWKAVWDVANQLAEKYGFFEIPTKEVYDYHPERVQLPAGLFRNAAEGTPPKAEDGTLGARVKIYVKCTSRSQMLGMAEPDLYVMEAEQAFWQNYLKSGIGLWCRILLVLGVAICLNTYLDGIVAFLTMSFLFVSGFFTDYISELANGNTNTGGPFRSLNQLLQAKQPTAIEESTAATRAALFGDSGFAWFVRRFVNLVPDVNSFSWTPFVSEGFNISIEYLIMNILVTMAYLFPWFILGFYLIRSREVAA